MLLNCLASQHIWTTRVSRQSERAQTCQQPICHGDSTNHELDSTEKIEQLNLQKCMSEVEESAEIGEAADPFHAAGKIP